MHNTSCDLKNHNKSIQITGLSTSLGKRFSHSFLCTELGRNYSVTLTIGPEISHRTRNTIWFQIEGTSTNWTEWFSQAGENDLATNKTFWRVLTDVGDSTKVRVLMQINNDVGVTGVGVDDNYLAFGRLIEIAYYDGMRMCLIVLNKHISNSN